MLRLDHFGQDVYERLHDTRPMVALVREEL